MEVTQPPEVWVTNSPAELGTTMVKVGLQTGRMMRIHWTIGGTQGTPSFCRMKVKSCVVEFAENSMPARFFSLKAMEATGKK